MICSIVSQLYSQSAHRCQILEDLFDASNNGQRQPSVDELLKVLRGLIDNLNETFIVIDALDECDEAARRKSRQDTLRYLTKVLEWKLETLHVMITSRPEKDIEDNIQPFLDYDQKICIQSALVEEDIRLHIRDKIQNGKGFARWKKKPNVREEIELDLMAKVDGM